MRFCNETDLRQQGSSAHNIPAEAQNVMMK
jgi:hypothetical protein